MRRFASLRSSLAAIFLLCASAQTGCSVILAQTQVRGNKVDLDSLKELVPGTATRADATSLLGSPTAKGSFDDNTWIYIGEVTRPVIGATQSVLVQQVVVLTFDQAGVLRDVKTLDKNAALPVNVVSRATPSPGNNASLLQQLLGNVGRFNATPGASGSSTVPGGGALNVP
jgi:outer membrane protein assembly factor BamE (lipoprotein component of BamABCDE complex)